jgi:hypothetical protein
MKIWIFALFPTIFGYTVEFKEYEIFLLKFFVKNAT